jgi:hypothetical protein
MSQTTRQKRARFRRLHDRGCFILPRRLASLGFAALATTSASLSIEDRDVEGGRKPQVTPVNRVNSGVYTAAYD